MKPRAQLDHLLLDADFFDKPKAKALLHRFGPVAQLFLVRLYLSLSRATNAEISKDAALGIAWEVRLEGQAEEILAYLVQEGMLQITEGGDFTAQRVVEDQEKLAEARAKWRAKKGPTYELPQGTSLTSQGIPLGKPPPSQGKPPESVKSEDLNTEDLDLKKTVTLPNPLQWSAEELATLERWRAYQATRGNDLDQIQLEAIFSAWNYDRPGFMRAANFAIANRHKNLNPQPDPQSRAGPREVVDWDEELRKKKREELKKWAARKESQAAK